MTGELRKVSEIIEPQWVREGAGVKLRRSMGSAALDHLVRLIAAVHMGDLHHARRPVGGLLVGQEVVPDAVDQGVGHLGHVAQSAVDGVALQHRQDLVVGLVAVEHAQPADRNRQHEDVAENNASACAYCHGADYRGGPLSTVKKARSFNADGRTVNYAVGQKVGCYDCHNGPRGD